MAEIVGVRARVPVGKLSWAWWLAVPVLVALYVPTLAELARLWRADQYAGHGVFVPAFSAFVLWLDRSRLRAAAGRGEPAGLVVILAGLGLLALGRWVGSPLVQAVSLVVSAAGLLVWGFGARCLRAGAFPVGFLVFMAPLPRPVVEAVTLHLQLFAAGFAGQALDLFGVPFFLNDIWIELPGITLAVAQVCNGLRFLMGLLVLTLAFAHVSQRSLARKCVLVASAVPIAVLANAVRVAAVAIAVAFIGPEAASGWIHNSIGKGVWALTLIPLFALGLLLRREGRGRLPDSSRPAVVPGGSAGPRSRP